MLKYKVILSTLLLTTIAFAIVPVSMRMRGLGPSLVGIVDDEYSDLFFNPAYINRIEGSRVYTNLSNLHNFGEDQFFDPWYVPYMYYNLIGGITDVREMKLGALLETGGWDAKLTGETNSTEIDGNDTYVDTSKYEMVGKNKSTALDLFWGKKMSRFDVGLMLAPEMANYEETEKSTEISYYYHNDTLYEYNYEHAASSEKDKVLGLPFVAGIIMGEPEDELSVSLGLGMQKYDYLNSYLEQELWRYLQNREDEFEITEYKEKGGGFFGGVLARKKLRKEDYSLSFLGGLSYSAQPIEMSMFDSSYYYYKPTSFGKYEYSSITKQTGDGSANVLQATLGVGAERFFDVMGTKNLFAIGFLPSFYSYSAKLTIKPETTNYTYYNNYWPYYPDTLAYTAMSTSNETWDIKYCNNGLAITLPVGLETHLTDRLVFRLGATEDFILMLKSTYEEVLKDGGEYYIRDVTIGTNYLQDDTIIEPSDELDSASSKSEYKISWDTYTTYHYGLGYKINDNIELNFLNFAQLTDMRTWVLGVNIKF